MTDQPDAPPAAFAWPGEDGLPFDPATKGGDAYRDMIEGMREFLDTLAAAAPDQATIDALAIDVDRWKARLASQAVPESEQYFGRRIDLPGRGQTMLPAWTIVRGDAHETIAQVRFGRYHMGTNQAAHGGAIALLFDDLLGKLSNSHDRGPARTAYLKIDFRAIAPIGRTLDVRGWFVSEEGRKRLIRGELRDGDRLCAEAEGLFVILKPGQP
jgi:acyl-coenzyme A thioesterase PaaI-like protein